MGGFPYFTIHRAFLTSIAYLAIFGALAGFTSYLYLLQNVRLATATTYAYGTPLASG